MCFLIKAYLECSSQMDGISSINGKEVKKALDYKYLRSIITSDGSTLSDAKAWVTDEVAPAHWGSLEPLDVRLPQGQDL